MLINIKTIIEKLYLENNASEEELLFLLTNLDTESKEYLFQKAYEIRLKTYGNSVFLRGLIEISSFCKSNCMYCGLRVDNKNAQRYRLSKEEIIECCETGYSLGFRTFVMQGGEDAYYSDELLVSVIKEIKLKFPDAAVTLSLGERSEDSYKKLYDAGADRYLLRHETANKEIYDSVHPGMSFENRRECLKILKKIGFQTGAGFLVGLPNQTNKDFVKDLLFIKELEPEMVGIGPFIPQKNTPLSHIPNGNVDTVLIMLALVRLLLPNVLLPATTALGTLDPMGREKGFRVGANVIMPNLSPFENRAKYALYDGKVFTNDEAAEELKKIKKKISDAGFEAIMTRGDNVLWKRK
ncbi:MAG: [FeFe] hydrogenase H-cluster radical SAM maturase HydE [Fusobacteriaceae bacterium]|nr:[FeFe] hydrogenase H-cluster radical SAM maturase HydE [Fusobacteriaceae bacterium]